ncbi:hypothetical protein VNI00_016071 [Paramarasmius palmivorus]|uniref:Membrane insertase YidC/Oxa/ALB C-terminal domain-containing protein n=1 Tax=Paramarasmius palmivorus TaxID=297713 RepID=A0AAW0BGT2_9AGAR
MLGLRLRATRGLCFKSTVARGSYGAHSVIGPNLRLQRQTVQIPVVVLAGTRAFSWNPFSKSSPSTQSTPASTPTSTSPVVDSSVTPETTASAPTIAPTDETLSGLPAGVDSNPPIQLLDDAAVSSATSFATTASDTVTSASSNVAPYLLQPDTLASLGLANWYPAGIYRWTLAQIHFLNPVLPWGYTIILTALLFRVVTFPFAVRSIRFASRVTPLQPRINELNEKMKEYAEKRDVIGLQRVRQEQMKVFQNAGIHPLGGAVSGLVQIPVAIGGFFGIKNMLTEPTVVTQLQHNTGFEWMGITDLTAADPTGILPVTFGAMIFWQVTVSASEQPLSARPQFAHIMNLIRFPGAPITAFLMASLPSGLIISILAAGFSTILQSYILRIPRVRQALGILPPPSQALADTGTRTSLPSFKDTYFWATSGLRDRWAQAQKEAQEKVRQQEQRRRGSGPFKK